MTAPSWGTQRPRERSRLMRLPRAEWFYVIVGLLVGLPLFSHVQAASVKADAEAQMHAQTGSRSLPTPRKLKTMYDMIHDGRDHGTQAMHLIDELDHTLERIGRSR